MKLETLVLLVVFKLHFEKSVSKKIASQHDRILIFAISVPIFLASLYHTIISFIMSSSNFHQTILDSILQ
jgi:hypothetical protein